MVRVVAGPRPRVRSLHGAVRAGAERVSLPKTVVVHLGTNGPIGDDTLNDFFRVLEDVPTVLVLTARAPRGWIEGNNAKLYGLPDRFANVQLVDWAGLSNTCPGNCFYDDGIHLRPDGARYYAQVIEDFLEA